MPFLVLLAIVVAVKYGLKFHALWEESENKRLYHRPLPDYPSSVAYEDNSVEATIARVRKINPEFGAELDRKQAEVEREHRERLKRQLDEYETIESVGVEHGLEWRLVRKDDKTFSMATNRKRIVALDAAEDVQEVRAIQKRYLKRFGPYDQEARSDPIR